MKTVNLPLEDRIICKLTMDKEAVPKAVIRLKADDFTNGLNQQIFHALLAALTKREEFSLWQLEKKLADKVLQLQTDLDLPGLGIDIDQAITELKECTYRRKTIFTGKEVVASAQTEKIKTVKENIAKFFTIEDTKVLAISAQEASEDYLRLIEKRKEGLEQGVPYPYEIFQVATQGAKKGEFIVIAARPGIGKSALMQNMAFQQAREGFKVLFLSIEMSIPEIMDREVARLSFSNPTQLRGGDIDFGDVTAALDKIKNITLWSYGSMTTLDIRAQIQLLALTSGIDIVYIDYLQLIKGEGKDEYSRVTRISNELKAIAMDFQIPVVAAAQYNRNVTHTKKNQQPQLSDLRDSGAIEQDANIVFSLWKAKNPEQIDDGRAEIIFIDMLKNRSGGIFLQASFVFQKEQTAFTERGSWTEPPKLS